MKTLHFLPLGLSLAVAPAWADHLPAKTLDTVTINGGRPTSLPTQIPTTIEGITGEQIENRINATDSEDALKYFPSLNVRKRYIGDYDHAVLASRASGTGNSARSLVYADGILLSNLLGNGANFTPRWGLVSPEEIDRVDVLYGPFSAAYPGNSAGAVVDFQTRMPGKFEAHVKLAGFSQGFRQYGTDARYGGKQGSASVGDRNGAWSWWFDLSRLDSKGQPIAFANKLVSSGAASTAGLPVTGAIADKNPANKDWLILGATSQAHTIQDHAKLKLAYDFTPTLRASYTLGWWGNEAERGSDSYLRDAAGAPVYRGDANNFINIGGKRYELKASDFAPTIGSLEHLMHGLSVKSHTQGTWDWEVAASLYDYQRDDKRQNAAANVLPAATNGGAGTLADGSDTGWATLALKGTWRPSGIAGAHIVDFGYQQERYRLRYLTSALTSDWINDAPGARVSDVRGQTQLQSLYAQDAWAFAQNWKTVLGLRAERWTANDGFTAFSAANTQTYADRSENHLSPKVALSYRLAADTVLKGSVGRAVRMPTVAELYGATSTTNSQYINDPNLKPEKSWTTELSAEKDLGNALLRLTFFTERTRDALYTQTTLDPAAGRTISRVQNVGLIETRGVEAAYGGTDVLGSLMKGLDVNASVTYADSVIKENAGFVTTPGDTVGKWQPNVPRWRATVLATYRIDAQWTTSLGARYSGKQYRMLDNSDVNGFTYQGVSRYFTVDLRVRYKLNKQWTAAFGIDNLNNYKYWNFHPYPQRSYSAELKFDL